MAHYFTREEAEALVPRIARIWRKIQEGRGAILRTEDELDALRLQAADNGHHLHERMMHLQQALSRQAQMVRGMVDEVHSFGCELKDPERGLIDFLSLRDGHEIYLCWFLGEERINYWHYLHTGLAGRQPL
ncbi:MAG: DUF2203 domain-containing protein [Ktedonobacteraceae bacterium]